jgi:hypothetical protein
MAPFIMHGDRVVLRRADPQRIRVGSVVAFRDEVENYLILHRVVRVNRRTGELLTMGDCQLYAEPVQIDDALGEVIRVVKDDLILDVEDPLVRACSYVAAKNSRFFVLLQACLQRFGWQRSGLKAILLRNRLAVPSAALAVLRRLARRRGSDRGSS